MTLEGNAPVVSVRNLFHRYRDVMALDGVTLDIPARKMIGLIGPDGVGKSTLLAILAGVRKLQDGEAQVLGGDINDPGFRNSIAARIAYLPQGLGKNLYPTLSVYENIDFFGRLFGQSAAERAWRIEDLLWSTDLTPFRDRPAGKLSGGMKQKLGLCCSLIHDPDLLILDEPTTGVDPLARRQFWELINRVRVRRPQMSVMVATAYMDEAEGFEWLVAMNAGKVMATGTAEELRTRTGQPTLEKAFIRLLPEEATRGHKEPEITPWVSSEGPPAIESHGLTQWFGDFTAVDHVNFRIEQGEIFGFLGSNGCGKTTTMKMLTGLLPPTEGEALLFGKPVKGGDIESRRRVGFMSQAFSLYTELTVRQNMMLHAHLFDLPKEKGLARVEELIAGFGLEEVADTLAESLPLGIRQRLSLAVAVLHEPEVLILDEPTSGVDPVARDGFWELLIRLSRENRVTIFLSTHFMNEAERCDRMSMMHRGKVLAQGVPADLVAERGAADLEEAFIGYLEEAAEELGGAADAANSPVPPPPEDLGHSVPPEGFSPGRVWAFARREAIELRHDAVRLAFAIVGPLLLMIVFGYGISLDVDKLAFAVLDHDNTPASRAYADSFRGSVYFDERAPLYSYADRDRRLRNGELRFAVEIPGGFQRDLQQGRAPTVQVDFDAAVPFRAETAKGYVEAAHKAHEVELRRQLGLPQAQTAVNINARALYNQAFLSVYAMVPGDIMLLIILIPSMLTALAVVREKELGSIANFYAAPASRAEFLLGKQLPYVGVALIQFVSLVALAVFLFGVPIKGSILTLAVGGLLYVLASTGFGLLISVFAATQTAAIFAAAIITILPAVQFSGMFVPVSSLTGGAAIASKIFPSTYFHAVSVGTFTKALDFAALWPNILMLAVIALIYFALSVLLLKKQEA
ncbi:ribosome-associated ATPase/putative transporter RbbA [Brevundimonas sp. Root1279]|uniref:ribosome-associated ATPase/putative transporter RbbA n=1 Tax=Brevundimonas sp. Root1279 TaxID=1736443 RepID=UPI0006F4FFB7|nr:ribosome-associated ATPase/putative transporter RbbA [Brevundimonas sp. Root1279]KQW83691.1 multidrug ABC transporter ATP-binding protein [Brevundimonas sp. Root1279]